MNKNEIYHELKNFIISDHSEKYEKLNEKLINIAKNYFNLIKNNSIPLSKIENSIYSNKHKENKITIESILINQHNLIKELVQLINNILLDIRNSEFIRKYEEHHQTDYANQNPKNDESKKSTINDTSCDPTPKNKIPKSTIYNKKTIIPLNVVAPKNNIEFNGTVSFLNFTMLNSKNKISNNPINDENIIPKNNLKKKSYKSSSTSNIFSINTNDNNTNPSDYHYLNTNTNTSNLETRNYTIDDIKSKHEKQIPSFNDIYDTFGALPLPEIFNKRKKKIKYRVQSEPNLIKKKYKNFEKNDYRILTNSSFPTLLTVSDSAERFAKKKCNSTGCFNDINKIDNKFIIKTKLKAALPTKLTKEMLNRGYKIIHNYQKKMKNKSNSNNNKLLNRNKVNCSSYY